MGYTGPAMVLSRRTLPETYGTSTIRKKARLSDGTDSFVSTRCGLTPMAFCTAKPQEQNRNQPRLLRLLQRPVRIPPPCLVLRIQTPRTESDLLLTAQAEAESSTSFYKEDPGLEKQAVLSRPFKEIIQNRRQLLFGYLV